MIFRFYIKKLGICLIGIPVFLFIIDVHGIEKSHTSSRELSGDIHISEKHLKLEDLNKSFYRSMLAGDTASSGQILKLILNTLKTGGNDSLIISDSYYYLGVYHLFKRKNTESLKYLGLSYGLRKNLGAYDTIYAKILYNLGIVYNNFGDFNRMEQFTMKSLEVEKGIFGDSSFRLLWGYSNLVTAYLGLKEYDRAIDYGKIAIKLIEKDKKAFNIDLIDLYTNMGVCYIKVSDYSKAVLYLEIAEAAYKEYDLPKDERYVNLMNSLAAANFFLDLPDKSDEYYGKGLKIAESLSTFLSHNFVSSFARVIGKAGKIEKGEELMLSSLRKVEKDYGAGSEVYIYVLKNYADYLRNFRIDIKKSLTLYEQCISYMQKHKENNSLKGEILLGYALALTENGNPGKALEIIQQIIFGGIQDFTTLPEIDNPDLELIKPDQWSLSLYKAKHRILSDLYNNTSDAKYIIAASSTSELVVSLLEKVRINIDEEESRIVLGDKYRDFYINAIRDCEICFRITGRNAYKEKAFEYSERSKAAALLASTRELKATQFHIPPDIAELEKRLQQEISFCNAKISEEVTVDNPDSLKINEWKKMIFIATQKRDSLIDLFEKKYPGYYLIKYNREVAKSSDIPGFAGRNSNYISYVVGDNLIYIFVVNRKNSIMTTVEIDSLFFDKIREFRKLLSTPSLFNNARNDYDKYQHLGEEICDIVFKPVQKFLISDRLLISPDYILSYIPFEVLPESKSLTDELSYKNLPFLTKKYKISYTYSATFLAEKLKAGFSQAENLIAFAPSYTGDLEIDSLLRSRQQRYSKLSDIPFARMEAEFACNFVGGKLCLSNDAKESVFKSEAGKYDIIHLAMHTVLNDQNPMQSKMIFSQVHDSIEDGMLNTYEVYGIPLKAKMVILSSCNTGTGILHSGEGILSLARGFMYSGSKSVIMSLWEIEDRSGTEIIEDFYRYLKKGYTKSDALRHARLNYLKKADLLKSHPYFWSTLVIYGNNDQIYHSGILSYIAGFCILILIAGLVFFYRKSK
jgi:CHAT domain-containing protein/tetratricopeptide (TPR) repeat protein